MGRLDYGGPCSCVSRPGGRAATLLGMQRTAQTTHRSPLALVRPPRDERTPCGHPVLRSGRPAAGVGSERSRFADPSIACPAPSLGGAPGARLDPGAPPSGDGTDRVRRPITTLLVEDDDAVREIVQTVLEREGHVVLTAANGVQAVAVGTAHGSPIDLLLTDVVLPRMTGFDVADHLRETHPNMTVLFVSGYLERTLRMLLERAGIDSGDEALRDAGILEAGSSLLLKPFTPSELRARVRSLLGAPDRAQRG